MQQYTEPAEATEKNEASNPPNHFLCPITSECMYDPVLVTHDGFDYRFERTSLEAHAQTRYRDRNPLTNKEGFSEAVAEAETDTNLQKEIHESQWAPQKPEAVVIENEEEESESLNVTVVEFHLPSVWLWNESMWPRYSEAERSNTLEDCVRFYFGDNISLM